MQSFDDTLIKLNELELSRGASDQALDLENDAMLLTNIKKMTDIIDSVPQSVVQRIDDAICELETSIQSWNYTANPTYGLSQIGKDSSNTIEFITSFLKVVPNGPYSSYVEFIRNINVFNSSLAEVLSNTKKLTWLTTDKKKVDQLINRVQQSTLSTLKLFRGLQNFWPESMDNIRKINVVINSNNGHLMNLKNLGKLLYLFAPSGGKPVTSKGDLGDIVDSELSKAADDFNADTERLAKLN